MHSIPPPGRKDRQILERLTTLAWFTQADTVLGYASFRSEVDTFGIMRYCVDHGKKVVLPRVEAASKTLRLYNTKLWPHSSLDNLPRKKITLDRAGFE